MPLVGVRTIARNTVTRSPIGPHLPGWRPSAALFVALVGVVALLSGCAGASSHPGSEPGSEPPPGLFPVQPVTVTGQSVFNLYTLIFAIAVVVFILVEGLLLWSVIRYRRRATDTELPKQTHGNNFLEVVWTVIPALIVTILFVLTVETLGKFDPVNAASQPESAVTIDVTGLPVAMDV